MYFERILIILKLYYLSYFNEISQKFLHKYTCNNLYSHLQEK